MQAFNQGLHDWADLKARTTFGNALKIDPMLMAVTPSGDEDRLPLLKEE